MCSTPANNRAVFLDRDGVLIRDVDLLTEPSQIQTLAKVPDALQRLAAGGFRLIVVTNQTVVARGLATEAQVDQINATIAQSLVAQGAPPIDRFYVCPHHPNATLPAYQSDCQCRKPRPGMLLRAAQDYNLNLSASFLVGDRMSDIVAGAKAGCRTVMVHSGWHRAAPIQTVEPMDAGIQPDWICEDLLAAADWILNRQ